jgi:hypothetical protein
MAITFTDKKLATEYVNNLIADGYEPEIIKKQGQYIVSKGNLIEKNKIAGIHYDLGDEHVYATGLKSSTSTKLHELGHGIYNKPAEKYRTKEEQTKREIQAETFSRAMRGLDLNENSIMAVARQMIREGAKPSEIMTGIQKEVLNQNYEMSPELNRDIWEYLKEQYNNKKAGKTLDIIIYE